MDVIPCSAQMNSKVYGLSISSPWGIYVTIFCGKEANPHSD